MSAQRATAPLVEVLEASTEADPRLAEAALDEPTAGASDVYALRIGGSVAGTQAPVEGVRLVNAQHVVADLPVGTSGEASAPVAGRQPGEFRAVIGALSLPVRFDLRLRALLADGRRANFARIRGTRKPLESQFEAAIKPLLVTTVGRTGSNYLMSLLGSHPDIVAYDPFRHEPRVAAYWLGVLRSLAEPTSYRRQIAGATNTGDPRWWLGGDETGSEPLLDAGLDRWLGGQAIEGIAALCQQRIEAVYRQIARQQGRSEPAWFAEKSSPGWHAGLMRELYPGAAELFLVRDFRDVVCSRLAYGRAKGHDVWQADDVDALRSRVRQLSEALAALVGDWRARSERAHLVKYEDLVLRPAETLAAVLEHLGAGGPKDARAIVASLEDTAEMRQHRTAASPRESIGRWRAELGDGRLELVEKALGDGLAAFGYAV